MDKDRDTTMRGKDVFDVAHYPTAHYVTKSITKTAAGFSAVGALTLRGVTKDVPIEFQFAPGAAGAKLDGSAKLNRLDFGVGTGRLEKHGDGWRRRENQFFAGAEAQGSDMPRIFDDVAECVENTLSRVGSAHRPGPAAWAWASPIRWPTSSTGVRGAIPPHAEDFHAP